MLFASVSRNLTNWYHLCGGISPERLLMSFDNRTGKGTSSNVDKFSSVVDRVHMELGGKLLNSSRIETQFLERLQSVGVVDGAAHTQKDDVESNGGSMECCKGPCAVPLRRSAGSEVWCPHNT